MRNSTELEDVDVIVVAQSQEATQMSQICWNWDTQDSNNLGLMWHDPIRDDPMTKVNHYITHKVALAMMTLQVDLS